MLFPIERLLVGREDPTCVRQDQTIREALVLMLQSDFSQLPVIDNEGELVGLISSDTIIHRYFHVDGEVAMLDLPVHNCLIRPVTLTKDRDIFEALDRLKDVYAIVIVEENRPTGVLTEYDMAHFFRNMTEDLLTVEDIEVSLRQTAQRILATTEVLNEALINAHGEDSKQPGEPRLGFDELSFGQLIRLITHPKNWAQFEDALGPMDMFERLMEVVRVNRNQLAHFRGELGAIQQSALKNAQYWLEARPKLRRAKVTRVKPTDVQKVERSKVVSGTDKYGPLRTYLYEQQETGLSNIRLEFRDLESLLGFELPDSARKHRAWWGNDSNTHPHARAWMAAGWLVDDVDMNAEQVSFRATMSARYPLLFGDLLTRLKKERPGITRAERAHIQNWLSFGAGVSGYLFGWALPKEPVLRVELYIDTGDREKNKEAFDRLYEHKAEIENEIQEKLHWDRLEKAQACRIWSARPFTFSAPEEEQEEVKSWGVQTMLKFVKAFQPYLRTVS